ncbi:MAG: methyltransferase domain-containing protein [Burkholderiales bacterium]|jgi:ubiquinone/menaquinone biosynthesis C-methylase UbiE
MDSHDDDILDQFTKQADLFQATHRLAEDATRAALEVSGVCEKDVVLDVACGPGILACAFARHACHVTGVDITPAMLERAAGLQRELSLQNVDWLSCDVNHLPFEDERFSILITRYAFHHLEQPVAVLAEMARVCAPGGKVVVIDAAPPAGKADAFNEVERMRDPSHTEALPAKDISRMMLAQGLQIERSYYYAYEVAAHSLLARSFPTDGDRDRILHLYENDVGVDRLAMNARRVDGILHVTFPTMITLGRKA